MKKKTVSPSQVTRLQERVSCLDDRLRNAEREIGILLALAYQNPFRFGTKDGYDAMLEHTEEDPSTEIMEVTND